MNGENFMLNWAEHEKSFIASDPGYHGSTDTYTLTEDSWVKRNLFDFADFTRLVFTFLTIVSKSSLIGRYQELLLSNVDAPNLIWLT